MTDIEWAGKSWNPIVGCSPASEGCSHCYARGMAKRLHGKGIDGYDADVARWKGATRFVESKLDLPQKWRAPQIVFLGSMTDLFHESTPAAWVDRVLEAADLAPRHRYLILTKRPERAFDYFRRVTMRHYVWIGVSVENQKRADERIPVLLETPAAIRFVSYEPALGPVDFNRNAFFGARSCFIDWVIAGAEQGSGSRPAELDWFRQARDQCAAAGVPFFFKKDSQKRGELDGVAHEGMPDA